MFVFFFLLYCEPRDLHVLTHSFPTRRSSDLPQPDEGQEGNRDLDQAAGGAGVAIGCQKGDPLLHAGGGGLGGAGLASLSHAIVSVGFVVDLQPRSEEHTSELQSLMRISYAVFCLKKKNKDHQSLHTST